jgi:imidazolonepropionase-like amidohydrolase
VFDGATATTHPGWVVLVRGEKTAAPGAADEVTVPKCAKVIEPPGATLLPGLIKARPVMQGGTLDGMVQR